MLRQSHLKPPFRSTTSRRNRHYILDEAQVESRGAWGVSMSVPGTKQDPFDYPHQYPGTLGHSSALLACAGPAA